jgi:hypothetical protein
VRNLSEMGSHYLLLDSAIRDWVVLPIIIMTIMLNIVRNYGLQLMKPAVKKITPKDLEEIRHKQTIMKAARLRGNGSWLCADAFNKRKAYLTRKKVGLLREKVPQAANPMSNPMQMVDMMKGRMSYMVTNIGMMSLIGYLYSGFVCLKIPFPIPSTHFKLMLQVQFVSLHLWHNCDEFVFIAWRGPQHAGYYIRVIPFMVLHCHVWRERYHATSVWCRLRI